MVLPPARFPTEEAASSTIGCLMTNGDFLISLFSNIDPETIAHFMTKPMHYEDAHKFPPETEGEEEQIDFIKLFLASPRENPAQQGAMLAADDPSLTLPQQGAMQHGNDADPSGDPQEPRQRSKEDTSVRHNGGIRTVSKLFREVFDKFAKKKITIKTFKAYNSKSLHLMQNVVWLEMPHYSAASHQSPNVLDYTVFVHSLEAVQLRSLLTLKINSFSSYDIVASSNFMKKVVPELNLMADREDRCPLTLDVFSSGFTHLDNGQFWCGRVLTRLVQKDPSKLKPVDRTIIGLIERCRTIEMSWAYNPYSALCVMKLARSAKTLRFSNTFSGLSYTSDATKRKILEVFAGDAATAGGENLFSNFERLEIQHHDQMSVSVGLLKSLCMGGLIGPLPLLSGVREVCITGFPSSNYCQCMAMTNVRKLEFRDLDVLIQSGLDTDGSLGVDWILEPDIFLRKKATNIAKVASCFPNLEVIKISLLAHNEVEVLQRHAGRAPCFLEAVLNELHEIAWSKDKLELHACKGGSSPKSLSRTPSFSVPARADPCCHTLFLQGWWRWQGCRSHHRPEAWRSTARTGASSWGSTRATTGYSNCS